MDSKWPWTCIKFHLNLKFFKCFWSVIDFLLHVFCLSFCLGVTGDCHIWVNITENVIHRVTTIYRALIYRFDCTVYFFPWLIQKLHHVHASHSSQLDLDSHFHHWNTPLFLMIIVHSINNVLLSILNNLPHCTTNHMSSSIRGDC